VTYLALRILSKGLPPSSSRSHKGRRSIYRDLLHCFSKSPVNESPPSLQVPQRGSYGERCPFPEPSFTYLLKSPVTKKKYPDKTNPTALSKSPVKELPLQGPPAGSLQTEVLHFQSEWFIYLFIHSFISFRMYSYVLPRNKGENIGSPFTETYIHVQSSAVWLPEGRLRHRYQYLRAIYVSVSSQPIHI